MIPWIQVYSNLIQHPKTTELADELVLTSKDVGPNIVAAGMLVSLWLWAAQNATSGDLSQCTDRAIAEAAGYKKKPSVFVAALTKARFLDADRKLHDWDEYATLLMDIEERQRQQTRERVQKHRANKKAKAAAACNEECNVTPGYKSDDETPSNAPTVPNSTLPNLTLPNFNTGAAGDSAGAGAASESELLSIGIKPGEYFGITSEVVMDVRKTAILLFCKYFPSAMPSPWDYRQVFRYCGGARRATLLDYAFEKAAVAGKLGDWRYIDGIMDRLFARGIETEAQARMWDIERPDLNGEDAI